MGAARVGHADDWEWLALPVDGGNPIPTGAGDALRAAGLGASVPTLVLGNRILFSGWKGERWNVWQIGLRPGSWRVTGGPRQLTFATENVLVLDVSRPALQYQWSNPPQTPICFRSIPGAGRPLA